MGECTFKPDLKGSSKRVSKMMNSTGLIAETGMKASAIARLASPQPSKTRSKLTVVPNAKAVQKRPVTSVAPIKN